MRKSRRWRDGRMGVRDSARLRLMSNDEGRGSRWKDGTRKGSSSTVLGREYWSGHYKWIGVGMEQVEEDIIHSNEETLLKRPGRW